jgi:hypothetical protein
MLLLRFILHPIKRRFGCQAFCYILLLTCFLMSEEDGNENRDTRNISIIINCFINERQQAATLKIPMAEATEFTLQ